LISRKKLSCGFAEKEEDDYFPLRRRKGLIFKQRLQGRTAFGQTPAAEPSQGSEKWQT
jgi:hypothetical protein